MPTTSQSSLGQRLTDAFTDMLEQETRMVVDLLGTVRDTLQSGPTGELGQTFKQLIPAQLTRRCTCGCCQIPPPCWMPELAGEVISFVCVGGTATVQLDVRNCGATPRIITLDASPASVAASVKFSPTQLSLGPMERGFASASVVLPADPPGGRMDILLWVRGCKVHYVRWTIKVASRAGTCCHEVDIEDCPDYIHHWYDHFYCERPCLADRGHRGNG
jgi:hypothetical protein